MTTLRLAPPTPTGGSSCDLGGPHGCQLSHPTLLRMSSCSGKGCAVVAAGAVGRPGRASSWEALADLLPRRPHPPTPPRTLELRAYCAPSQTSPRKAMALASPRLPGRVASWQENGKFRGSTDPALSLLRREPALRVCDSAQCSGQAASAREASRLQPSTVLTAGPSLGRCIP